jgi:hypothetical protein
MDGLLWSFVSKITKSKHQITNKFQIPIHNDQNIKTKIARRKVVRRFCGGLLVIYFLKKRLLFKFWNFGHWNLFDIWDFN